MSPEERRRELAALLRRRRESLQPENVGLVRGARRRARGLRREEVAELSSISLAWYTWLEQGLPIRVSERTLHRIAQTLKLSREEWLYIALLAGFSAIQTAPSIDGDPSSTSIQKMLDAFTISPAGLFNNRFDVIATNAAARTIFGSDVMSAAGWGRNVIWRFFMDQDRRRMYPDGIFDLGVRNMIESLRMNWAADDGKGGIVELADELRSKNSTFNELWNERKVARLTNCSAQFLVRTTRKAIRVQYSRYCVPVLSGHAISVVQPADSHSATMLQRCLDRMS